MQKNIGKASKTNCSSFNLENIGYACHFAVGAWLSNFCRSNPLGTFSSKMESLQKWKEVLRIGEERREKKWQPGSKYFFF